MGSVETVCGSSRAHAGNVDVAAGGMGTRRTEVHAVAENLASPGQVGRRGPSRAEGPVDHADALRQLYAYAEVRISLGVPGVESEGDMTLVRILFWILIAFQGLFVAIGVWDIATDDSGVWDEPVPRPKRRGAGFKR